MLTNRELASLILISLCVIGCLFLAGIRKSIFPTLKILLEPQLFTPFLVYFGYVTSIIFIASYFRVWYGALFKDTLIVTFGVGLPMLIQAATSKSGSIIVRKTFERVLGISTLLVFYLNLSSFSIFGELILQVVTTIASIFLIIAMTDSAKYSGFEKFLKVLLAMIGIGMLTFTTIHLTNTWHRVDSTEVFLSFAMTLWLPFTILPFAYVLGFYSAAELALTMVKHSNTGKKPKLRVLIAVLLGFRGKISYAANFIGDWRYQIASVEKYREARKFMALYRSSI